VRPNGENGRGILCINAIKISLLVAFTTYYFLALIALLCYSQRNFQTSSNVVLILQVACKSTGSYSSGQLITYGLAIESRKHVFDISLNAFGPCAIKELRLECVRTRIFMFSHSPELYAPVTNNVQYHQTKHASVPSAL
jgi:hypothetical protein